MVYIESVLIKIIQFYVRLNYKVSVKRALGSYLMSGGVMLSRWIAHVVQFRSLIAVDGSRRMRKVNFPRIIGIWLIDLTPPPGRWRNGV